jgi:hypothetical protein
VNGEPHAIGEHVLDGCCKCLRSSSATSREVGRELQAYLASGDHVLSHALHDSLILVLALDSSSDAAVPTHLSALTLYVACMMRTSNRWSRT